jgi:hypothetical protein
MDGDEVLAEPAAITRRAAHLGLPAGVRCDRGGPGGLGVLSWDSGGGGDGAGDSPNRPM